MSSTTRNSRQLIVAIGMMFIVNVIPIRTPLLRALSLSKIEPNSGVVTGGNKVIVRGEGFMRTEGESFDAVAAGVNHALMLSDNGHVWSVGSNKYGQLGTGKILTRAEVVPVDITKNFDLETGDSIASVAAGDYHSFAVSRHGRVFGWGNNSLGQVGNGTTKNIAKPSEITSNFTLDKGDYIERIFGGAETSFAISGVGRTFGWGDASNYQMPVNEPTFTYYTKPQDMSAHINGVGDIKDLSVGNHAAIALTARNVFTWGRNDTGQLGRTQPGEPNRITDVEQIYHINDNFRLDRDDKIIDVEAGNGVMAALAKSGRVFIWGGDKAGMLGVGGEIPNKNDLSTGQLMSSAPIDITDNFNLPDKEKISQISVGNSQVLALSQYGLVYSWGGNSFGQLGDGGEEVIRQPEAITANFNLPQDVTIDYLLAAGKADGDIASYSYAVDSNGKVYAWGGDQFGMPGINAITNQPYPTVISDRLMVDVPNIETVRFGDAEADFTVIDDKTIRATVPEGLSIGEVTVSVVDSDGNTTEAGKYTYKEVPATSDDNNDKDMDDNANDDNNANDGKDDVKPDNQSADGGKDKSDGKSNDNGSVKSGKDATASSGSKYTIAAPNTGIENN